jgi:hypothetical protein
MWPSLPSSPRRRRRSPRATSADAVDVGNAAALVGQVLRPDYQWLLEYRAKILLRDVRTVIDPTGFARLTKHG